MWGAHCPVIDAAESVLQEKTGRHVRFTPPHHRRCRKKVLCKRKQGGVWDSHHTVIDATEKRCFARGNRAACEVHTALSLTLQKKGVLREETGWHVRFTPPYYQHLRKKVFCERKRGGMWGAHHPTSGKGHLALAVFRCFSCPRTS